MRRKKVALVSVVLRVRFLFFRLSRAKPSKFSSRREEKKHECPQQLSGAACIYCTFCSLVLPCSRPHFSHSRFVAELQYCTAVALLGYTEYERCPYTHATLHTRDTHCTWHETFINWGTKASDVEHETVFVKEGVRNSRNAPWLRWKTTRLFRCEITVFILLHYMTCM